MSEGSFSRVVTYFIWMDLGKSYLSCGNELAILDY